MLTTNIIESLQKNLFNDLLAFTPELLVCVAIVVMLCLRLLPRFRAHLSGAALVFTLLALVITALQWWAGTFSVTEKSWVKDYAIPFLSAKEQPFTRLLALDHLTCFLRLLLLTATTLVIWLTMLTGIPDEEDSADFYTLLLGGTLGMMLMASSNHLLMVFIAVEMASLPSYGLAGFLKGRRQSSEAALKYVVYGGGASGVMLYGMSLVAGRFGTGDLTQLGQAIRLQLSAGAAGGLFSPENAVVMLGLVFIFIGLAFKLSAVPFHFWCPDVFEGAAAEVGGFLSVASKAAALALTGRLLLVLTGVADEGLLPLVPKTFGPVIACFAAITATFGNLAAYAQTNLKRLLAYSTIAHAGYMLMGLAPMTADGASAVLFYLVFYIFMNLGAFGVVAFLRNQTGSEDLSHFRGLVYRSPLAVILLGVFMLSLLGIPPLAGFWAKYRIFSELFKAGNLYSDAGSTSLGYTMYTLLIIGGLNTVFSLFYYVKVLRVMVLDQPVEELEGKPAEALKFPLGATVYASVLALVIFPIGVAWERLDLASVRALGDFRRSAVDANTNQAPVGPVGGAGIINAPPRFDQRPAGAPKGKAPAPAQSKEKQQP
jgi:NADH-quinone oxidoreductase subunit N